MTRVELLNKIEKQNAILKQQLNFEDIVKNQKQQLLLKIAHVGVGKYKDIFKLSNGVVDENAYLIYVSTISKYLQEHFLEKVIVEEKCILGLHRLIFEPFKKRGMLNETEKKHLGRLRKKHGVVNFFHENQLHHARVFEGGSNLKKCFKKEIQNFNNNVKLNSLETIVHFAQYNLSKIHPFYNGNGRVFFMLFDILLLRYGYTPLFIRGDKDKYDAMFREDFENTNFDDLQNNFLKLILDKYNDYHIN